MLNHFMFFLRIYNVLCGQYNYNQFDYQRFLDEVNLWLDNQRPIEAILIAIGANHNKVCDIVVI